MSTFRNALVFFDQLGVYDVVLPFLLIFTLVFAMLEKTKVLGKDNAARKNLGAMIAFCTAFLVVASSQLVAVINATIAKAMILLVMSVLFMMLLGSFGKDHETVLEGPWKTMFMFIMFIGIALILLYQLGRLQFIYEYASGNLDGPVVGSIVLLLIVVGFMMWIYSPAKSGGGSSTDNSGGKH